MELIRILTGALSMFTAIPMPQMTWTKTTQKYVLCAFPLAGVLIGLLSMGWVRLCAVAAWPDLVRGLGLCLAPVLVTGGIHLDGCCDTWDALASHGSPEKKREILSDPHIGSFAVIRLICMMLTGFVLFSAVGHVPCLPLLLGYVLSRSLSAAAVVSFPTAEGSRMLHALADGADKKRVALICYVLAALTCLALCAAGGAGMAAAQLLVFAWYRFRLVPLFGGLSGDLAGWFVQTAELWMLIALFLSETVGRMTV